MGINKRQIEEFRESIVDVIQSYGIKLSLKSGTLVGLCPFHDDHKPSMRVEESPFYRYRCWVCSQEGDVFDFVALKEGYNVTTDFVKVAEIIAGILRVDLKFDGKKIDAETKKKNKTEKEILEDLYIRAAIVRKVYAEWCSQNLLSNKEHFDYITGSPPAGRGRCRRSIEDSLIGLAPAEDKVVRDAIKKHFTENGLKFSNACAVASGLFKKKGDRYVSVYRNCYIYAHNLGDIK